MFLVSVLLVGTKSVARDRPNLLYIMVDDMGFADLSCYGRKEYKTPNIDALAEAGMMFTQAYAAAPVCTPTRVAFMTGRYPARNPIGLHEPLTMAPEHLAMGLDPSLPTLSSLLKQAGYETALIGKWHLGFAPEYLPLRHGFDYFFGITAGGADYVDHKYANDEVTLYENDLPVERVGYLTDLLGQAAVDLILRKRELPFFLSLQFTAPHWPWQGPGDPAYEAGAGFKTGGSAATYARMMHSLDDNIGKVIQAVKESGEYENTLIIFTSDNGGEMYSGMGPFRGRKFHLLEGGIRVPAIAVWPRIIRPGTATSQVAITMDWTATLLEAAGITAKSTALDGISLLSQFEGGKVSQRTLYWRTTQRTNQGALRRGDWKYLKTEEGEFLFNLADDPGESRDLKMPEGRTFRKLRSAWARLNSEMLSPVPLIDD
jgi:arylsulfatase A-like enzyme